MVGGKGERMTNEEAIKELRDASDNEVRYGDTDNHYDEVMKRVEAFDMAIKALEQQPCEDAISRQAVKETIFEQGSAEKLEIDFAKLLLLQRAIKALPSVTPQPTRPTARWETLVEDYNKCSKCGEMGKFYRIYKYCPNCGARMAESEDEE
jgi:ribosomal protein S27AE